MIDRDEQRNDPGGWVNFIPHPSSLILSFLLVGCSGYTGPRSVANEDPAVKIPQMHKAVQRGDMSVLPQLVKDLDSDDSAVRLHAIGALRQLTGESLDYNWTEEDRAQRRPFIEKWEAYVAARETPSEGK
jgi:hypothetical protein